jgi:hypothetical protein
MDPRACLHDMENRKFLTLPGLELRFLGRPASSQSLYRLSYPGSLDYEEYLLQHSRPTISRGGISVIGPLNDEFISKSTHYSKY